jgi:RsiW-degrading membrane proteinase PrsW (M82 family)
MDLLAPSPALIIWTLFALASLLCLIIVLISIFRTGFKNTKVAWLVVIILLPILGPILFFVYGRRSGVPIS